MPRDRSICCLSRCTLQAIRLPHPVLHWHLFLSLGRSNCCLLAFLHQKSFRVLTFTDQRFDKVADLSSFKLSSFAADPMADGTRVLPVHVDCLPSLALSHSRLGSEKTSHIDSLLRQAPFSDVRMPIGFSSEGYCPSRHFLGPFPKSNTLEPPPTRPAALRLSTRQLQLEGTGPKILQHWKLAL